MLILLAYLLILVIFAVFTFAVTYHYLRFRFSGDQSTVFLTIFLGYSAAVILLGFFLLFTV